MTLTCELCWITRFQIAVTWYHHFKFSPMF